MRIRTIKPDFWLHEGLAELSAMHRLLFIGLWMLADKAGRLEDKPKRIAAALFPYDQTADVNQMLGDLDLAGHVHRYGDGFLAIPGFLQHQRPHPKEAVSTLPEPPSREKKRRAVKFPEGCSSVPSTPVGREGKESQEGKGREGASEVAPTRALSDALIAAYLTIRGEPYRFNKTADGPALQTLLRLADLPTVTAKWERGLRLGRDFPGLSTIAELAGSKWNHLSAPTGQAYDPNQGILRARDAPKPQQQINLNEPMEAPF